jgi:glycosyltransferase involved in cell wall biosynthesis
MDRQSFAEFEVIIADDGSTEQNQAWIKKIIHTKKFPVNHIWHEDLGWRKTTILNKAVKASQSDYLIFIDGDCIPHKHFVREHMKNKESGIILSGRRLNLSKEFSESLTARSISKGFLEKNILLWLWHGIQKKTRHAEKGLYLPLLRPFLKLKSKELLGCNFSIYKDDLYRINGFDERYMAPTFGEDTDIEYRARLLGIKIKSVRNLAVQYHLYHKLLDRKNENQKIFEETKKNKAAFTSYGLIRNQ